MEQPVMLDTYCCAGGAAAGYARAGWRIVGVDKVPQPNYPYEFHQADAVEFINRYGGDFDAHHSSPPCQGYTSLKNQHGNEWPLLIQPTRRALIRTGRPYVIENVVGARPHLIDPVMLCGEMFGLAVIRHRLFETNWGLTAPAHRKHRGRVAGWRHGKYFDGPYFAVYGEGGGKGSVAQWQRAMGIDWTSDRRELAEAIPPAYTQWIGCQLEQQIESTAA